VYFGGGLARAVPRMELGVGVSVNAQRWFPVGTLILAEATLLQIQGGGYASVDSLIGNGTISLLGSSVYIGNSVFDGTIQGSGGSSVMADGLTVNNTLLLDGTSFLNTTKQGLLLQGNATLQGGFVNSGSVSIFPRASLSISGLLELKLSSVLRIHGTEAGKATPIKVEGPAVLGGSLHVAFAFWHYLGNETVKIPIISATGGIKGSFSLLNTTNAVLNPNSTHSFFIQVEDGTVSLVYGNLPASSPNFLHKYWKIMAGAGGGLVLIVVIAVVVGLRVRKARKAQESPENEPLME